MNKYAVETVINVAGIRGSLQLCLKEGDSHSCGGWCHALTGGHAARRAFMGLPPQQWGWGQDVLNRTGWMISRTPEGGYDWNRSIFDATGQYLHEAVAALLCRYGHIIPRWGDISVAIDEHQTVVFTPCEGGVAHIGISPSGDMTPFYKGENGGIRLDYLDD